MNETRQTIVHEPVTRGEYDAMIHSFAGERREIIALLEDLPKTIASSVEEGTRKALLSPTILDGLHDHFAKRSRSKLAEWVFDRLLAVVATFVLTVALAWYALFKNGK